MKLHIVLVEPEIPQNTGNIARTCAATGSILHLVKPLGFQITDKYLKRAGLDYWDKLDIYEHNSFDEFLKEYPATENNMFFVSTKAQHCYSDVDYSKLDEVYLLFGKETKGLPEDVLKQNMNRTVRIPMRDGIRSLNLSNSVSILVYEVLRQTNFEKLLAISDYFE